MITFANVIGIYLKIFDKFIFTVLCCFLLYNLGIYAEFEKLPNCQENTSKGLILVSTLDGKFSALNGDAKLIWQRNTGPGPLLTSNIHNLELTNNGHWIRIIPSLSGTLYKFDGQTVDQIPVSADHLLRSSFKYSDDLVIAGGVEVRKYGVSLLRGDLYYTCSLTKCVNETNGETEPDDVLIIERSTQTVRAIEPRTGNEKWNFSVGMHDIRIAHMGCIYTKNKDKVFSSNISAILPDGVIRISYRINDKETVQEYTFSAPIVHIWKWDGNSLHEVDLFRTNQVVKDPVPNLSPALYLGMHMKQLYIREAPSMQNLIAARHYKDTAVAESTSIYKIPWKPIPASAIETYDDSTALSVLYASEYINGNGYYLYSERDFEADEASMNETEETIVINEEHLHPLDFFILMGRETLLILSFTFLFIFIMNALTKTQNVIVHHISVPQEQNTTLTVANVNSHATFSSRYMNDFDTLRCIGKGGFGVVFEVKQKIDECSYAIKRITLPSGKASRNRVLREVKALAKLDHQHIVRYFNSWVESPPHGWLDEYDKQWIEKDEEDEDESSSEEQNETSRRTHSVSVNIELSDDEDSLFNNNDAYNDSVEIVFENEAVVESSHTINTPENTTGTDTDTDTNAVVESQTSVTTKSRCSITDHIRKKNFWRQSNRQYHSWDLSNSVNKQKVPKAPATFLYIQMQLCQQESLNEWLTANSNRNFDQILDIFKQILSAVHYVHLQGLIHRDLKPSNIFFSLEGQVKVGDFGLVKDMEESLDLVADKSLILFPNHTKNVGTYLYMSPEQLKSGHYNHKVDIYSLGLIFFELLVPFSTNMERVNTLTDLRNGKYPSKFSDEYPEEYKLLKMMLCKQPEQRLTTIGIKAKAPVNCPDSKYGDEYHYVLPK